MTEASAPAAFARTLIIDKTTNIVLSNSMLEPGHVDPNGNIVVASPTGNIGDTYANGIFTHPLAAAVPSKDDLTGYAAYARWRRQTGGMTLSGMAVKTDADAMTTFRTAIDFLNANSSSPSISFKGSAGYVSMPRAQVFAIWSNIAAFYQNCFAAEAAIEAKIGSGAYAAEADIDGASEWPSNVIASPASS